MQICTWDVDELAKLVDFYNRQNPDDCRVSTESFLRGAQPDKELLNEQLIVCQDTNKVIGYAHVGTGEWKEEPCGILRFFSYEPSLRSAGQIILDQVDRCFDRQGMRQIRAGTYGYSLPGIWLTERMAHVMPLLIQCGYKVTYGNISFSMKLPSNITEPSCPDEDVQTECLLQSGNGKLPNSTIRIYRAGQMIGESSSFSAAHNGPDEAPQDEFNIGDIEIVQSEQGKGLGRYLLLKTIFEMARLGYTRASLSTGVGNVRARLLYANNGFEVTRVCHICMKDLVEPFNLNDGQRVYGYPKRLRP